MGAGTGLTFCIRLAIPTVVVWLGWAYTPIRLMLSALVAFPLPEP